MNKQGRSSERGAVLVIVLVMVGIFMIIVTSLISSSTINFKIAANQQYYMEAKLAAKNALEGYMSNPANFKIPLPTVNSVFTYNFDGKTDGNGDDVVDMSATVSPPSCTAAKAISQLDLDLTKPEDAQCAGSIQSNQGIIGASGAAANTDSWCSNMNWEVAASVDDAATGVQLDMTQGVSTRAIIGTPCPT